MKSHTTRQRPSRELLFRNENRKTKKQNPSHQNYSRAKKDGIPFSTGGSITSFVRVVDVASGGGSKTRREWRGHCDNKVAVDGRKSQDRSRCNETAKLKTNFVDKLVRQRIELRRGVLCAVVGGCLREGGLAKVGCGNNRHGEVKRMKS